MTNGQTAQPISGSFKTNDGLELRYVEAGTGAPLVLVHGWSHSAKLFDGQLAGLNDRYRVLALDLRGHGLSDKPGHGMRLSRMAKDVHEFLIALDLEGANVLGHGMGAAVLWSYWELFGPDRIAKLIFVDQSPFATANPTMTEHEMTLAGSNFDLKNLFSEVNGIAGVNGGAVTYALIRGMTSKDTPRAIVDSIVLQDFRLPRRQAAKLLYEWATQDWRDTIPRITVPSFVIGAKGSPVPFESQLWIRDQIKGARAEIFEADEGGSHFMFMENPKKFNDLIAEFIG
ncbi:MAG: alpha/beta hydrolase [Candidatus Lustribacter sp.]